MSSEDIAIGVRNVSKVYHVYDRPVDRLAHMLLPRVRKFVPMVGVGRWEKSRFSREFWALRELNFEVRKGDSLGIIGRNGSGKSTLLQIIAGTLMPSSGDVRVDGRVAALLELGSGFNPEFSGRENVILNGMILGLTQREMLDRFDDIAAFADIGEFLEQPVKTYSSGMMLRLAFAVQTQIRPDILIVDEALSVGDALFQKRCFQQMERLRNDGCTLLFVSHDQESIRTLTSHALLLRDGVSRAYGVSSEVLLEYRRQLHDDEGAYYKSLTKGATSSGDGKGVRDAISPVAGSESAHTSGEDRFSFGDMECSIGVVRVLDSDGNECSYFYPGDRICIEVGVSVHRDIRGLNVNLRIRNKEGVKMYSWGTLNQDLTRFAHDPEAPLFWDKTFVEGEVFRACFEFDCALGMNFYEVQASVSQEGDLYYGAQRILHWRDEAAFFQATVRPREYSFGGVVDMKMKVSIHD